MASEEAMRLAKIAGDAYDSAAADPNVWGHYQRWRAVALAVKAAVEGDLTAERDALSARADRAEAAWRALANERRAADAAMDSVGSDDAWADASFAVQDWMADGPDGDDAPGGQAGEDGA